MKKAAIPGGLGVTLNPTLVPGPQHRARAHAELQLLYAGFTSSQAEVGADLLLRRLNVVLDNDSSESNVRSHDRDDIQAKSVSFLRRDPLLLRWPETENGSAHPADKTGALDKGGNR